MSDLLQRVHIVLCRPEGGGNVGSVCRAMKNMGLSKLTLVSPSPQLDYEHLKIMAVHAEEIFESAPVLENLSEALKDCVFSVGITRRRGNRRKSFSYLPEELAEKMASIKEGEVALVFGNEQNGLNDNELSCCSSASHIPSSPNHPSLNLSHAVQIMTYTLFRQGGLREQRFEPITEEEKSQLTEVLYQSLSKAGVIKFPDTFDNRRFFSDLLGRATLSRGEAKHLEKLFQALRYRNQEDQLS